MYLILLLDLRRHIVKVTIVEEYLKTCCVGNVVNTKLLHETVELREVDEELILVLIDEYDH